MPPADAPDSTPTRPRWTRDSAVRWLVSTGRRPAPAQASWLIPGPDGPKLSLRDSTVITVEGERLLDAFGQHEVLRTRAHTYVDTHSGRRVWLVTPMLPTELWKLSPSRSVVDGPLHELARHLVASEHALATDGHLGVMVLLPVNSSRNSSTWKPSPPLLVEVTGRRGKDLQLLPQHAGPAALADLVAALGHRLPLWPPDCATADLVALWRAEPAPALRCEIPPVMQTAWRYHELCHAIAQRAPEPIAPGACQVN